MKVSAHYGFSQLSRSCCTFMKRNPLTGVVISASAAVFVIINKERGMRGQ